MYEISENMERFLSQFPRAQDDVLHFLSVQQPKSQSYPIYSDIKQRYFSKADVCV